MGKFNRENTISVVQEKSVDYQTPKSNVLRTLLW